MTQDQNFNTATQPEQYEDYWGVQETFRFELKNGQFFEIKPMDEGAKTKFQKMTNKGIRMDQRKNEATIDVDPADERHTLILESVVSWHLMQRDPSDGSWSPLPCSPNEKQRKQTLREVILTKFNPKVIQELEFFIRTKNPWMQSEMNLDDLLEQRDDLDILIKQKREELAGESSSANK